MTVTKLFGHDSKGYVHLPRMQSYLFIGVLYKYISFTQNITCSMCFMNRYLYQMNASKCDVYFINTTTILRISKEIHENSIFNRRQTSYQSLNCICTLYVVNIFKREQNVHVR